MLKDVELPFGVACVSLRAGVSGSSQIKQLSRSGITYKFILSDSNVLHSRLWETFINAYSTKECFWWNVNANNQLRIMNNPWFVPSEVI